MLKNHRRLLGLVAVGTLALTFATGVAAGTANADGPGRGRGPGPGAGGSGEKPTCDERCSHVAERVLEACTKAGGENCADKAATAKLECMTRCENPPTPLTCTERCDKHAAEALARCTAAGSHSARA